MNMVVFNYFLENALAYYHMELNFKMFIQAFTPTQLYHSVVLLTSQTYDRELDRDDNLQGVNYISMMFYWWYLPTSFLEREKEAEISVKEWKPLITPEVIKSANLS